MKDWVKQFAAFSVVSLLMCAVVGIVMSGQAQGNDDFLNDSTIYLGMLGEDPASGSNARYVPASGSNAAVLTITGNGVTLTGAAKATDSNAMNLKVVVKAASGSNAELTLDEASWSNDKGELLVLQADTTLNVKGECVLTQDFSKSFNDALICEAKGDLALKGSSNTDKLILNSVSYYGNSDNGYIYSEIGVLDVKGELSLDGLELDILRDKMEVPRYNFSQCKTLSMVDSIMNVSGILSITTDTDNSGSIDQKSLILVKNGISSKNLGVPTRDCLIDSSYVTFYDRKIEVNSPKYYITPVATDSNAEIPDFVSDRSEDASMSLNLDYIETVERDVALDGYWSYNYKEDTLTIFKNDMAISGTLARKKAEKADEKGRVFQLIAKDTVDKIKLGATISVAEETDKPLIKLEADSTYLHRPGGNTCYLTTTGIGIQAKDLEVASTMLVLNTGLDGIQAGEMTMTNVYYIGYPSRNNNLNLTGDLTTKGYGNSIEVVSNRENVPALKAGKVRLQNNTVLGAYSSKGAKDLDIEMLSVDESLVISYTGSGLDNLEPEFVKIPEDASKEYIDYNHPYYSGSLFAPTVEAGGKVNPNAKYYLHNTEYAIIDEYNLFQAGEKTVYTVTLNAVNGKFKRTDGTLTDKLELTVDSAKDSRQSEILELVPDEGFEIGNYTEYKSILSWFRKLEESWQLPNKYIRVAMDEMSYGSEYWNVISGYMTIEDLDTKELTIEFPEIGHSRRTLEFSVNPEYAVFTAPEEAVGQSVYTELVEPGNQSKTVTIKVKDGYELAGWTINPMNWDYMDIDRRFNEETNEYSLTIALGQYLPDSVRKFTIEPKYIKIGEKPTTPSHSSGTSSSSGTAGVWHQAMDGNGWIFTDYKGNPLTGWQSYKNCWYLTDDNGRMLTGWRMVDGKWYYLHDSGMMATGWLLTGDKWFYLNKNGDMLTGWQMIGQKWYYLDENGIMASNGFTLDGYYVDETGAWNYKAPVEN